MRYAVRVALCSLAALVAACLLSTSVLADATPLQLILLYMPNVSTTDTPKASGIAELVMLEGEVRIKTADLPRLDDGQQYVAWVINSDTNEFQRLGAFNTTESSGAVDYENVLPDAIPDKHWNLLLVTVENSATPDKPSSRHSIAGLFPSADNAPLPIALPNTGGEPNSDVGSQTSDFSWANWQLAPVLAALALGVTFGAGYALGRRRTSADQHSDF